MRPPEPTSDPLPGVPVAYEALRNLARRMLRRWTARHRIGRTSLVHETYLRLAGRLGRSAPNQGRPDEQHGLALAARAMRFVLIDSARRAATGKRTGADRAFSLDDVAAPVPPAQLVALGDALDELAAVDPRRARIVELRAFGGMTVDEVAGALGVSAATVHREWPLAKAWLFRRLRADAS
jgi:RNA polymerase sigma factor (TIGR02999 family)